MPGPLEPAIDALKAHAPTSRHAEMLFGLLVDLLGDQAVVKTENDGTIRTLFRRDAVHSGLIVPWPVAQLSVRGRIGYVSPTIDTRTGEVVAEPERPAGKAYKLRGLGPGEIDLFDGSAKIGLVYGDDGGSREPSLDDRTPSRLAEIPAALASRRAQPAELIAGSQYADPRPRPAYSSSGSVLPQAAALLPPRPAAIAVGEAKRRAARRVHASLHR